jgi:hypothetical protein
MRTVNYKCDRCGRPADKAGADFVVKNLETGLWQTRNPLTDEALRPLTVRVGMENTDTDFDKPELCGICLVDVLIAVAKHVALQTTEGLALAEKVAP